MLTTHKAVFGYARSYAQRFKAKVEAAKNSDILRRGVFYLHKDDTLAVAVNYDLPVTEGDLQREISNLLVYLGNG